jgi:hypothetical protein
VGGGEEEREIKGKYEQRALYMCENDLTKLITLYSECILTKS